MLMTSKLSNVSVRLSAFYLARLVREQRRFVEGENTWGGECTDLVRD